MGEESVDLGRRSIDQQKTIEKLFGVPRALIAQYRGADAFFVGSSVKEGGVWSGKLDAGRTRAVADALRAIT